MIMMKVWHICAFMAVIAVTCNAAEDGEEECWPSSNCCPLQEIISCNEELLKGLETFNDFPNTAFAQKCGAMNALQKNVEKCKNLKGLNHTNCHPDVMTITDSWATLIYFEHATQCSEVICDSPDIDHQAIDKCMEPLENTFEDFTSLCGGDHTGAKADAKQCLTNALNGCGEKYINYWSHLIEIYTDEVDTELTKKACAAKDTCTDVPKLLDDVYNCYHDSDALGYTRFLDFCTGVEALKTCLDNVDTTCEELNDLFMAPGSIVYKRMAVAGCYDAPEIACHLKEWDACHDEIRNLIGDSFYNYRVDEFMLFDVKNVDFKTLCSGTKLRDNKARRVGHCATPYANACKDYVEPILFDIDELAITGKLVPELFIDTLNPEFFPWVKSDVCDNAGCTGLNAKLTDLEKCTSTIHLNNEQNCQSLKRVLNCVVETVSTCGLLHETVKVQFTAIPNLMNSMANCGFYPPIHYHCLRENEMVDAIIENCKRDTIASCSDLEDHMKCISDHAAGCDFVEHSYYHEHRVDLSLYAKKYNCDEKDLVPADCDWSSCYNEILPDVMPALAPNGNNMPISYLTLQASALSCNDREVLVKAEECAAQKMKCSVDNTIVGQPKAIDVSRMISFLQIKCSPDNWPQEETDPEKECQNGATLMADLESAVGTMPYYRILTSNVRKEQIEFGNARLSCPELSDFINKYKEAAKTCALFTTKMFHELFDIRDLEAIAHCQINARLNPSADEEAVTDPSATPPPKPDWPLTTKSTNDSADGSSASKNVSNMGTSRVRPSSLVVLLLALMPVLFTAACH